MISRKILRREEGEREKEKEGKKERKSFIPPLVSRQRTTVTAEATPVTAPNQQQRRKRKEQNWKHLVLSFSLFFFSLLSFISLSLCLSLTYTHTIYFSLSLSLLSIRLSLSLQPQPVFTSIPFGIIYLPRPMENYQTTSFTTQDAAFLHSSLTSSTTLLPSSCHHPGRPSEASTLRSIVFEPPGGTWTQRRTPDR